MGTRIGVLGATGLVGTEILRILEERAWEPDELRAFASERSVGRRLPFAGGDVTVRRLEAGCFRGLDLVVVDVDDPIAAEWAPRAVSEGARVVDNSAAFRMDDDVPLVVTEVNPGDLAELPRGIAACPNCTTMVLVTALAPLHRAAGLERLVVSTYQSVSGAGQAGIHELEGQWTKLDGQAERLRRAGAVEGGVPAGEIWPAPIAGNVIPLAGSMREEGRTSEEWKLVRESRKILHLPELAVSATCVRVPVYVGHAVSANVRLGREVGVDEAVALLDAAPGVRLTAGADGAPTPLHAAGVDPVLVGRVRADPSQPRGLDLWVTGDNLRKGAALNAVQIAELLLSR